MASYVITGAARGIGYEFVRQLSANPENTVFGLVRDKSVADKKVEGDFPERKNIHILQADVTDYAALQKAVAYVSDVTGGSIDYVISNAAIVNDGKSYSNFGELSKDQPDMEKDLLHSFKVNTLGPINVFNLFVPLLLKGKTKKAIAISSGMADTELVAQYDVDVSPAYAISKAALNMAVAKLSAEYRKDGVLFLSLCPGVVDTSANNPVSEEDQKGLGELFAKFQKYAPHFQRPATPEESVKDMLSVIEKSSVDGGQAGSFISHFGNKRWL